MRPPRCWDAQQPLYHLEEAPLLAVSDSQPTEHETHTTQARQIRQKWPCLQRKGCFRKATLSELL